MASFVTADVLFIFASLTSKDILSASQAEPNERLLVSQPGFALLHAECMDIGSLTSAPPAPEPWAHRVLGKQRSQGRCDLRTLSGSVMQRKKLLCSNLAVKDSHRKG